MKKILFTAIIVSLGTLGLHAQLSSLDIGNGLKEALNKGVQDGTTKLSAVDGFFKNAAIKILMPPDAQKVESKLRSIGMGPQIDQAIMSMNRAAEDASKSAGQIFLNAITQMTVTDAIGILKGGDSSATTYLRIKTTPALVAAFTPVIKASLDKVGATKYWANIIKTYNAIPFVKKANPDLTVYVTDKALMGMFYEIAQEEVAIRKNPAERTSALLKSVFGQL